jgi:hypothetical protein
MAWGWCQRYDGSMPYQELIARYRATMELALETVRDLEAGGWRLSMSRGDEPERDFTADYLAEKKVEVETCKRLIALYEARDAQGS